MAYDAKEWTVVVAADDVTDEIMQAAREIESGWFTDRRIDWADFWERLEGTTLDSGLRIDLGPEVGSPAMKRIQRTINAERRAG